jgi:hypothetical protein
MVALSPAGDQIALVTSSSREPNAGSCCLFGPQDGGAGPRPNDYTAGTLVLTDLADGGPDGGSSVTWVPSNGAYKVPPDQYLDIRAGDRISVTATGADVHAFSATVVEAPPMTALVTPDTVPHGSDWTVTWVPASSSPSSTVTDLLFAPLGGRNPLAECRVPDSAGTFSLDFIVDMQGTGNVFGSGQTVNIQ